MHRIPRTSPLLAVAGFAALGGVEAAPASAQQPPEPAGPEAVAERCVDAPYREFDFWEGEWEVRDLEGEIVGYNTIARAARGCALLETWRGVRGGRGVSVNAYDSERGRWTQRWVGEGAILWLEGGWEDGHMVLTGTATRSAPRGTVVDRIWWEPLPDGRVRQVWEVSLDRGDSWEEIFVGLYSPVPHRHGGKPASRRKVGPDEPLASSSRRHVP